MNKYILHIGAGAILSLGTASIGLAQTTPTTTTKTTTVTETRQNSDGTYSVIEYPVGKEVIVNLAPSSTIQGAKGTAKVMRTADGTTVVLDLTGVTGDTKQYNVYAVDPTGAMTSLGAVNVENGAGTTTLTTPLDKFMLMLSPEAGMTTVDNSKVFFRSGVPTGNAVVPVASTADKKAVASGVETKGYNVPLLGLQNFKKGETEIRVKFNGDLQGLKGKAYLNLREDGATQIKMRFDDMKMAPKNKRLVLWTISPDNAYSKVGQVINTGERQEGEVRGETSLKDFGLFVTLEEKDVSQPSGTLFTEIGS